MDIISTTSPQTSMTTISTKLPLESFFMKPISDLEVVPYIIISLKDYYFNSQTK